MSGRGLPGAYDTALDSGFWRPVLFVELTLSASTLRLHDYVGDIVWNSLTWTGVGSFGRIDVVEEGEQVSPYALTLTLSNIDTTLAPEAIGGELDQTAVAIYWGMLDDGAALLADPVELWSGVVDATDIIASRVNGAISVTCESDLGRFSRISGALFSAEDLRASYVGDTFFNYLPNMQDLVIEWKETRGSSVGTQAAGRRAAAIIGSRR